MPLSRDMIGLLYGLVALNWLNWLDVRRGTYWRPSSVRVSASPGTGLGPQVSSRTDTAGLRR